MSKVYCKNCKYNKRKYHHGYPINRWSAFCNAPKNVKFRDAYDKPYKVIIREQFTLNAGNKCKLYKRKWWKIWLTELSKGEILFYIIIGVYFGSFIPFLFWIITKIIKEGL